MLVPDTVNIKEAGENERLAGSNYNGKYIEIVVTQHMEDREPVSPTRCEQFKRKGVHEKISYSREWYYILPELTEELYPYFIFFHGVLEWKVLMEKQRYKTSGSQTAFF